MSDPFSLAAGAFAVLGAADVVLKASVACCHFLSEIRDAPNEIHDLHTRIEENKLLIEAFKKHFDGVKTTATPSATPTMKEALKLFESSTNSFKRELSALEKLGDKYKSKRKIWSALKYHLDDRKVSRCLRNLENAKNGLCAALSLVDSVPSLAHQKSIEKSVQRMITTTEALRDDMTISCQRQVDHMKIHEKILSSTERHLGISESMSKILGEHLLKDQNGHAKIQETIAASSKQILDAIQDSFANFRMGMSVNDIQGQELFSIGTSYETLVELLMHMKPQIRSSGVSAAAQSLDVDWLQDEFKTLVTSSLQQSLNLNNCSGVFDHDDWISSTQDLTRAKMKHPACERFPKEQTNTDLGNMVIPNNNGNDKSGVICLNPELFVHRSSVGRIYVNVPHLAGSSVYTEARLLFVPSPDISSASLAVRLLRVHLPEMKPKLYTQLVASTSLGSTPNRVFVLVESISDGTIQEIDGAIRNGRIHPYDRSGPRYLFYFTVGCALRLDVLRYLERQGIQISNVNGENEVLAGVWSELHFKDVKSSHEGLLDDILAFLDGRADYCMTRTSLHLISPYFPITVTVTRRRTRMIRRYLEFLKRRGYDFDHRGLYEVTSLLLHMRECAPLSLVVSETLLELGANPHVTDCQKQNVIQYAMYSAIKLRTWRKRSTQVSDVPDILQDKLELLIRAGVDLEHKDNRGRTLSQTALKYDCWETWCKALKACGKPVEEVVQEIIEVTE